MKKFFVIAFICMFFVVGNANAFLTLDPTKGIGRIFTVVSDFGKEVQAKVTSLQQKVLGNKFVKGTLDRIDEAKEFYEVNKSAIDQNMSDLNKIKDSVTNSDAYKAKQLNDKMRAIDNQIEELENKKNEIDNQSEAAVATMRAGVDAQIKVLDENTAALNAMSEQDPATRSVNQEYINDNSLTKSQLEDDYQALVAEQKAAIEDSKKPVIQEINKLNGDKDKLKDQLKGFVLGGIKALDAATAIKKSMDNVYAKGPESAENVDEIRKKRYQESRDSAIQGLETGAKSKIPLINKEIKMSETATAAPGFDTVAGAINASTRTKIENAKLMVQWVKLLTQSIKSETANEYVTLKTYTNTGNKDNVVSFNLDDYKYTSKKGGKK